MPYTINTLPQEVQKLPNHAQNVWLTVFNKYIKDNTDDEEGAFKAAWGAVKNAGYKKQKEGNWIKKMSENTFNYIYTFNDMTNIKEAEILRMGSFNHPVYGLLNFNQKTFDTIINNFNNKVRGIDIAVNIDHGQSTTQYESAGWFRKLYQVGTKLMAEIEWTTLGLSKIKDGLYKYFSPEIDKNYKDVEKNIKYGETLVGGALTNYPFIKKMAPIVLSDQPYVLNMLNIYEEEKQKGGLFNMNERLLKILKLSDKSTDKDIEVKIQEYVTKSTDFDNLKTEFDKLEKDKEVLEISLNELKNNKTDVEKENIKLNERLVAIETQLMESKWDKIYNIALSEGKMTPKMEEKFKTQYMKNPELTKELIDVLEPIVDLNEKGQTTTSDNNISAYSLFETKVNEIMTSEKITYEDAILMCEKKYPDLFNNMRNERGVN